MAHFLKLYGRCYDVVLFYTSTVVMLLSAHGHGMVRWALLQPLTSQIF